MEYTENQKKYIASVDGAAHIDAVEIIGDLEFEIDKQKELFRLMTIQAAEYKAWVVKAETELATERLALQIACDCINARRTRYDDRLPNVTPDTFREKAR